MTYSNTNLTVRALLIVSLLTIGLSFLMTGNSAKVNAIWSFYSLNNQLELDLMTQLTGAFLIVASALSVMVGLNKQLKPLLVFFLLCIAIVPLITLIDGSRWIANLGGFPAIGSGQGIIKYAALIPLALFIGQYKKVSLKTHAWLNMLPVVLVLFWIGGMKFTLLEAQGIESLVATSPFMSWLYDVFSLQMASNVIGVYDLFFACLLMYAVYKKSFGLGVIAIVACGAVFVMTQTFLFTADGAFSSETLITGLGLFVIKDLWFIANLAIIGLYLQENKKG